MPSQAMFPYSKAVKSPVKPRPSKLFLVSGFPYLGTEKICPTNLAMEYSCHWLMMSNRGWTPAAEGS